MSNSMYISKYESFEFDVLNNYSLIEIDLNRNLDTCERYVSIGGIAYLVVVDATMPNSNTSEITLEHIHIGFLHLR